MPFGRLNLANTVARAWRMVGS